MLIDDKNNALFEYCLRLGDDRLILGHRLSEWCGHAPILEEDIAITNVALDLIGQASLFLKYAGQIEGKGRDEDSLAYFRDDLEFKNSLLVEQENGDYAVTILRQFLFDTFDLFLLDELCKSKDEQLAAIASKAIKEARYHYRHSSGWLIRLGDGTEESHKKMLTALDDLWLYSNDMFFMNEVDQILIEAGIAPDLDLIKEKWLEQIFTVFTEATIPLPDRNSFMVMGGRLGKHSEYLGYILAEMQILPRSFPEAKW